MSALAKIKRPSVRSAPSTTRNAARTRAKILHHATREFSTRGFDGARVDRIAAQCRLSKNTMYHHFGSKDGLIRAVLESMYRELRQMQGDVPALPADPVKALAQIVRQTFRAFVEKPEIIRLLNEENLHKARHLTKINLRELYDPLLDELAKVLKTGADRGAFRSHLDPVFVYLTMSSMGYHFLSNSYTLQMALGRELSSPAAYAGWEAHIVDVVLSYCRRPSRTT